MILNFKFVVVQIYTINYNNTLIYCLMWRFERKQLFVEVYRKISRKNKVTYSFFFYLCPIKYLIFAYNEGVYTGSTPFFTTL